MSSENKVEAYSIRTYLTEWDYVLHHYWWGRRFFYRTIEEAEEEAEELRKTHYKVIVISKMIKEESFDE
jgi:hypothetical protein